MLCFWGAQVREGFELVKPDQVKHGKSGLRSLCPKTAVQDMSAGRSFVGFIRDGKVSVLRLRSEDYDHDGKLKELQLKNNKIRLIVCGGDGAVLLSNGGNVLIMDKSTVCRPLKGLDNRQVIQIACGDHHSMALTKDGQVLVWGENSHGQLGLRKDHPGSPSAQHVQSLSGIPLAQISAGGDHSFVLSLSGVVFGWGKNSAGQLGLGDTTDRHVPTVVNSLNRKKTVSISCGGEHTATLSKGGTVFTFGSGGSGQLGHNSFRDEHHPRVVAELWGSEVSQVTCGRHHTLVSIAPSKLIYSFGCWIQGKLGNGKMIKKFVPFPYLLHTECNQEYAIEKIIAGENNSFALFFKELGNESAMFKPNLSRGIVTLNERMIDRWVSERDSWVTIKREITKVFSSAACLNGSFLKGFSIIRVASIFTFFVCFHKLRELNCIQPEIPLICVSQVMKVVEQMLRSLNPNPVGEESLRLYSLLPELIRHLQKQRRTELTEALASKILQLDPDAHKVLEKYWSKLPDDWLKSLVKLFRKASAELIGQISRGKMNQDIQHLEKFLKILQMIYQVCCSANRDIPNRDFIIHEISDLLDTVRTKAIVNSAAQNIFSLRNTKKILFFYINSCKTIKILFKFPFAADTASKWRMFRYLRDEWIQSVPVIYNDNTNMLRINRESLLTDTLEYLRQNIHSFFHRLEVTFIGENGRDIRGLSAEFFSLLSQSLLWFTCIIVHNCYFKTYFVLLFTSFRSKGKILPPKHLIISSLFKPFNAKWLNSIKQNLAYRCCVCSLFLQCWICLCFIAKFHFICRQKYVDLYVDFIFNKSVNSQFEHFSRGFFTGCPFDAWSMFHPEELQELLHGSPKYEWKELQQSASYEKCSASDELIKNFWTVFSELSEENKRKFLIFLYGTDRVPVGGFSKRSLKILLSDCPDAEDRLPEAQTCFGRLILPKYSDINTLRNKLIHAISFCEVFGRE
uniref:HECT domain-containing protein n=1 Tax=Sinocyclocheilus rhinocerous TaxID=307959 RepID=A0A673NEG1_9TELE